jgi:hypothetical protein
MVCKYCCFYKRYVIYHFYIIIIVEDCLEDDEMEYDTETFPVDLYPNERLAFVLCGRTSGSRAL